MTHDFSVRLVVCINGAPVGPRLERGMPMPSYSPTYDDTPEGRALAEHDLGRIRDYVEKHEKKR
jgi:hypothetical protein